MVTDNAARKPVSIVIPNYNGKALLEKNLPSVLAAARHYAVGTELIVVDDASSDGSAEYLLRGDSDVRLIALEKNVGFARASDTGIRAARNAIVILLNTDVRVREDFIAPLVERFVDEQVFAVAPVSLTDDEGAPRELAKVPFFKRGYLKFVSSRDPELIRAIEESASPIYSFYAVGGHCAIAKSKYLALGGFDDLYYPFYSEDVDLCYRAWKHGWKTIFEPRSVVYHSASGPIHSRSLRSYRANMIRRNRILFVWKNITSTNYFYLRHLAPILFRSLAGIFVLDVRFYRALFSALSRLPQARTQRARERSNGRKLSDEEIFELTNSLLERRSADVRSSKSDSAGRAGSIQ